MKIAVEDVTKFIGLAALGVCCSSGILPISILAGSELLKNLAGDTTYDLAGSLAKAFHKRFLNKLGEPNHDLNKALQQAILDALQSIDLEKEFRAAFMHEDLGRFDENGGHFAMETFFVNLRKGKFPLVPPNAKNPALIHFMENGDEKSFQELSHTYPAQLFENLPPEVTEFTFRRLHAAVCERFWDRVKDNARAWRAYSAEVFQQIRESLTSLGEGQQKILKLLEERQSEVAALSHPPEEIISRINAFQQTLREESAERHLTTQKKLDQVLATQTREGARAVIIHELKEKTKELTADLDRATDWELIKSYEEERDIQIASIDRMLDQIDKTIAVGEASMIYLNASKILGTEGAGNALRFLESNSPDRKKQIALSITLRNRETLHLRRLLQEEFLKANILCKCFRYAEAESIFHEAIEADPTWLEPRHQYWCYLVDIKGSHQESHGNISEAQIAYNEAMRQSSLLAEEEPTEILWQRNLSISHERLGNLATKQGDYTTAKDSHISALKIRESLAINSPDFSMWVELLCLSRTHLGHIAKEQGDINEAQALYATAYDAAKDLVSRDTRNKEWQRILAVAQNNLGDIAEALGDLAVAKNSFTAAMNIFEALSQRYPDDTDVQYELSISHAKLGAIALDEGNHDIATTHQAAALQIAETQSRIDPENLNWQQLLCKRHLALGAVAGSMEDFTAAKKSFTESLRRAVILTELDPNNISYQVGLSLVHFNLGEIARKQHNLAEALNSFTSARKVSETLAAGFPDSTTCQRNLYVTLEKLGDIAISDNDILDAKVLYMKFSKLAEELTASDPENMMWQRDFAISNVKLGSIAVAQGDIPTAKNDYIIALGIREMLATRAPENLTWQCDLANSHEVLGLMAEAQGELAIARDHFTQVVVIREMITVLHPENRQWLHDLGAWYNKLGDIAKLQEDLASAKESYSSFLAIAEKLTSDDTQNTDWQRFLFASHCQLADLAELQGNTQNVLEHYQKCLAILETIKKSQSGLSAEELMTLEFLKKELVLE